MPVRHFRSRDASLWQSAADQVASRNSASNAMDLGGPAAIQPADPHSAEMLAVNAIAAAVDAGTPVPKPAAVDTQTLGVSDVAKFCATSAFKLAQAKVKELFTGDDSDVRKFQEEL